ncbi:MAG TPA: hypothetical protein DIW47_02340 [Bacteroidetes bacterium]|nr:hypothetical protein [Bacteroidota bacterium]
MKKINLFSIVSIAGLFFIAGCAKDNERVGYNQYSAVKAASTSSVPLGSASTFAVLAATTVTNADASVLYGDLGVSPGTAITGFEPEPINTIEGPGTVTAGLGIVSEIIYAGGPVAAQAQVDAHIAYNYLISQTADVTLGAVYQLDGQTFTPGVYSFPSSANLQVDGILTLDFQGNSDALFIFQIGSTLVTMTNSNVVAINTGNTTCIGSNVFWVVGSSATIDGSSFIGTVIAHTSITMTSAGNTSGTTNVSGRMLALGGSVTMVNSIISPCASSSNNEGGNTKCDDFVTGGGFIIAPNSTSTKATFGVSGGIKNGKLKGQLSYQDHTSNGFHLKSTKITGYTAIDSVTREITGNAKIDGKGSFTYTVIVTDNGEPGTNDFFSLAISNGYTASGTLEGGNIQLHKRCK